MLTLKALRMRGANWAANVSSRRASAVRPPLEWTEILLHPTEAPFAADSIVQSIRIDYPTRSSWTSGTDWWLAYFFVASLVFAYLVKPFLNVKI